MMEHKAFLKYCIQKRLPYLRKYVNMWKLVQRYTKPIPGNCGWSNGKFGHARLISLELRRAGFSLVGESKSRHMYLKIKASNYFYPSEVMSTGPSQSFGHPWFRSLPELSTLPNQQRSRPLRGVQRYRNGPPGQLRSRDTGPQNWPWKWATGMDLPAPVGSDSPDRREQIRHANHPWKSAMGRRLPAPTRPQFLSPTAGVKFDPLIGAEVLMRS